MNSVKLNTVKSNKIKEKLTSHKHCDYYENTKLHTFETWQLKKKHCIYSIDFLMQGIAYKDPLHKVGLLLFIHTHSLSAAALLIYLYDMR